MRITVEEASPGSAASLASDVASAFLEVVRQDAVTRNSEQAREIQTNPADLQ